MKNPEIAKVFRDIAAILEIKADNPFRIRAYERAAQNIENLPGDIADYAAGGKLRQIPGIGQDLADKINEFLKTGKIKFYSQLRKQVPLAILELLEIPGVGPKTAKLLHEQLQVKSLSGLEKAIRSKKLEGLPGIKQKSIENIVKGIAILKEGRQRMSLAVAKQVSDEFIRPLEKLPETENISAAGSLRRRKETVRDIDILVTSRKPEKIMGVFIKLPPVKDVLAHGLTKSAVRTKDGVQVDCRVVEARSFGAALVYFTGSKNFNIKLRKLAIKKGLKVNEYGVFKKDKFICGGSEEEVFKALGMKFIEPELREDNGEVELALRGKLPELVSLGDIKGDLHAHSTWSDGGSSIEEMASACKKRGYSYVAITDHSQGLKIAGGLSPEDLIRKKRQIDKINQGLKGFRVLFGAEVDIDSQGNLDYPDGILKEFDIVVAAIHSGFKQSKEILTRRLVNACKNKYAHIIAHPTGRLWGSREAYDLDFNELFKAAAGTNTCMEINSFTQRLDLNDSNCRRAKEMGVKIAINTDAHSTDQLNAMELGISVARRGWLGKADVINTLSLPELLAAIKK
ncbi:MAG: DNA polymerase/3'-5' exonuclease PolX [Candidatus Omnitrophota bacterium]